MKNEEIEVDICELRHWGWTSIVYQTKIWVCRWYLQQNGKTLYEVKDVDHQKEVIEKKQEDGSHYCRKDDKNNEFTL